MDQNIVIKALIIGVISFLTALSYFYLSEYNQGQRVNNTTKNYSKQEANHQKEAESFLGKTFNDPTSVFNFFLMVLSGILVFVSFLQLRQIITANDVSIKAANAAEKAAESIPNTERAYLFLTTETKLMGTKEIPPVWFGTPPNYDIQYRFENLGKTPAVIESVNVRAEIKDTIPSTKEIYNSIKTLVPNNSIVVQPENKWQNFLGYPILISDSDMKSIRNGTKKLYFYGIIRYFDVFRSFHDIRFILSLQPNTNYFIADGKPDPNDYF